MTRNHQQDAGLAQQRLRVNFTRGEPLKYLAHLDLMRLWERAMRRAEIPLVYSQGYNPRPKISLAAPLPVGTTSQAELMDIFLWRPLFPQTFTKAVAQQLPDGIEVLSAEDVWLRLPSMQSLLTACEYEVEIQTEKTAEELQESVRNLLESESIQWERRRDTGTRSFDLRAAVEDISIIGFAEGLCKIGMKLRSDQSITGRPEEVSAALGFTEPPLTLHRVGVILDNPPPRHRPRHMRPDARRRR